MLLSSFMIALTCQYFQNKKVFLSIQRKFLVRPLLSPNH
jgi:hypothetical protein